ncbi:unnamed protein product [Cylindrotheca closterium]|uniref:Helicase-associated domain-containing protein n=1 Tax=Cylindrotheca closterium TaxID=2856 RepID=A0AAD2JHJ9_9STRA|nr:unnamed protein product [Cylindrotheca closterium]
MLFTDNNKLRNNSYSYPSASGDGLLSLVKCPFVLPALEMTVSSSSVFWTPPLSFENPFDDLSMKPMPLRSQVQVTNVQDVPGEESTARFRPHQEKQWQAQFRKLVQFKLVNGHCCVPHSYSSDPILARWVKRQRYQYKKFHDCDPTSTMTTRRIQELESIGSNC